MDKNTTRDLLLELSEWIDDFCGEPPCQCVVKGSNACVHCRVRLELEKPEIWKSPGA